MRGTVRIGGGRNAPHPETPVTKKTQGRSRGEDPRARRAKTESEVYAICALTHAAQSAAKATHIVCAAVGTTSIHTSSPLKRCAEDAEVVTRHNQLQPAHCSRAYERGGR